MRQIRGPAHAANEAAWAAAFAKAQAPAHWLGITTIAGPAEAWFIEAHDSYESFGNVQQAVDDNVALREESDRFTAADGDFLSRSSSIIA